jgi:hypothetical protein
VRENGTDVLLGPSVAAEDLRGVTQMLVRVLLVIEIVDQADDVSYRKSTDNAPHLKEKEESRKGREIIEGRGHATTSRAIT